MKLFKKLIFAAAFFGMLFIGVSAEEIAEYPTGMMFSAEGFAVENEPDSGVRLFSNQSLEDYLIEQCMNHSTEIDISNYNISRSEIREIYFSFATRHPELLIRTAFRYICNNNNIIRTILPNYIFDSAEQDTKERAFMQKKINEYVELASQCKTPVEKLLLIHDKMVENYKYDSSEIDDYSLSYHAYGLLKNNTAVCQGYAQVFHMIARELGIETDFCKSDSINHIWNYVKLDGKWYHVDVTWDDPVIKDSSTEEIIEQTTAYHNNFLISDKTRFQNILRSYVASFDWETYLDTLPDCGNDFEESYLFNIKIPYTVSYDGKYFYAPCTYSNGETITFRSKNLKAGIIAASAPIPQKYGCTLYYYVLSDYNGDLTPTAVTSSNGQYSSFNMQNALNLSKYSSYGIPVIFDTSADSTDIFIWDMNTLTPACEKISID